ncbi:hypothetical protein NEOLEDRAFT_572957 [Neolentinus lepideus HHB14362 ss-1]|uniref:Uncharacterized protein n=1 Tax=Neolentinus lepideus HHB14362 ss-1 TaxID=1314782 RepID=A0A165QWK7_9AGAM|nr:hypothetical protein NEOLEDRAFT_572957 [Neolentinus lepideus HHB14362 ss-1]
MFNTSSIKGISLDAAGLVALADLKAIDYRTALTGTSSWQDILFLAPGIHCQQHASGVNEGEYPMAGSLTTGHVFRIENQATVSFLQRVGKTGHLTIVQVDPNNSETGSSFRDHIIWLLYLAGILQTIIVLFLSIRIRDWWAFAVVMMLIIARFCNVLVIRRRSELGWKGAKEPGKNGDLIIILSQDRWIRMEGSLDDLKAVTAGQWLRELSAVESFIVGFGTLLVYASAALASNASKVGSVLIACLLMVSVACLGLCNSLTKTQEMFGRTLRREGDRKPYDRRLDLVKALIEISKRHDWAVNLGLYDPVRDGEVSLSTVHGSGQASAGGEEGDVHDEMYPSEKTRPRAQSSSQGSDEGVTKICAECAKETVDSR